MVRSLAITLLRHGVTTENLEKKYVGWSDVPLSQNGIKQLQDFKKLGYPQGDVCFVSDLIRCKQTFEILYGSRYKHVFCESLREMNFGRWELKTFNELQDDQLYAKWQGNFKSEEIPDGENYRNFEKRVLNGWFQATSSFFNNEIEHIVIISHGGPIRLLLEHFAPDKRDFWDWPIQHGMGYTLTTTSERLRRNERCILLREVLFKEKEDGYATTIF